LEKDSARYTSINIYLIWACPPAENSWRSGFPALRFTPVLLLPT